MPSTRPEVEALLERLESCCADDLESQIVYDSTDPKLTPVFQERCTSTPGLPLYTDTGGRSTWRAIPVRGSAGWWGVTEMYPLYIVRYISGRNVSRNVFRKTFPAKMCQASCQECDRNALHSIRRSFSGRSATLRAPRPGFRLISASGSRRMSQNALFRSFSDRFLNPIPGGAP